ncbi:hypothetical protein [Tsuneonella rigui]|uniref:hypothetical protein n=1 Tax=Tsuneonella rigui TaxID=1708790 RepID=UPI000F7F9D1B|nr:hypothetical protein [Tsuneonella rigui]
MRLIGKSELHALARTKDKDLRAAVLALCAELEAANWRAFSEVETAYPFAASSDPRVTIDLDERHCAVVTFNFEVGMALVEFAGPAASLKRKRSAS